MKTDQTLFDVIFTKAFLRDLKSLQQSERRKLVQHLTFLGEELKVDPVQARPRVDIKLISSKAEGIYRMRIGRYRLIYELDEKNKTVHVTKLFHRKKGYGRLGEQEVGYLSGSENEVSEEAESDEEFYGKLIAEHRKRVKEVLAGDFVRLEDFDKVLDELAEEENE